MTAPSPSGVFFVGLDRLGSPRALLSSAETHGGEECRCWSCCTMGCCCSCTMGCCCSCIMGCCIILARSSSSTCGAGGANLVGERSLCLEGTEQ